MGALGKPTDYGSDRHLRDYERAEDKLEAMKQAREFRALLAFGLAGFFLLIGIVCLVASGAHLNRSLSKSRMAYVLLGLFLGWFGIHNFYAGYTGKAVAQLLITLFIGWLLLPLLALSVWILIEICTVTQDAQGIRFH